MHRLVLLAFLLLSPLTSHADFYNQAVQFNCSPATSTFSAKAELLENTHELRGSASDQERAAFVRRMETQRNLFIGEGRKFRYHCKLGNLSIEARMSFFEVTPRSSCALEPGGYLDLLVGGQPLFSQVRWDINCTPSVKEISLVVRSNGRSAELEFCGNAETNNIDPPIRCAQINVVLPVAKTAVIREQSVPILLRQSTLSYIRGAR